jgi:hypothetical protein
MTETTDKMLASTPTALLPVGTLGVCVTVPVPLLPFVICVDVTGIVDGKTAQIEFSLLNARAPPHRREVELVQLQVRIPLVSKSLLSSV